MECSLFKMTLNQLTFYYQEHASGLILNFTNKSNTKIVDGWNDFKDGKMLSLHIGFALSPCCALYQKNKGYMHNKVNANEVKSAKVW